MSDIVDKLAKKQHVKAKLKVTLTAQKKPAFNVVGKLAAKGAKRDGTIVIGAHYDHLGRGGYGSLAPAKRPSILCRRQTRRGIGDARSSEAPGRRVTTFARCRVRRVHR